MRLGTPTDAAKGSVLEVSTAEFPHKWAVMFLVAVAFLTFVARYFIPPHRGGRAMELSFWSLNIGLLLMLFINLLLESYR